MRSDRLLPCLLLLLTACEIEKVAIPPTESRVAMHSVLSPTATTQVVLLERTRNGTVMVAGPGFDNGDPVVSEAGIAESGALVRLVTPSGEVLLGHEDNSGGNGPGAGNYRFFLRGDALVRNAKYRLFVQTVAGENLSAETFVPGGVAADVAEQRAFDRSRDTLLMEWTAVPGARSYFVRMETPFGPRSFFTDSTRLRLTGELRNVDVTTLPRVFFPGFDQAVTVSAVDSNYYDWFRTSNDPLSGAGLVSRVEGGLGVFGSLVRLRYQELGVMVPQTEAVAGTFDFVGTELEHRTAPFTQLVLYVESRAARSGQADALSGRYDVRGRFGYIGCLTCGLLGTVKDGRLELSLLTAWSARDTSDVFTGEIRGDTIVGSYRGFGGIAHFVRRP